MLFDANFVMDICGTNWRYPPPPGLVVTGISIDSRTTQPGEMFAAIRGPRFDGHDFMDPAQKAGCAFIIAEQLPTIEFSAPVLIVPDVLNALSRLATAWRQRVKPVVVAITGSSGKTTVKEMTAACLKQRFQPVHATQGNLNNHLGLPITILSMPNNCAALVVEMGMSAPGEIAHLTQIAQPDIGVVTNVQPAHLQAFSGLEAIAMAKGELLAGLSADKVAIFAQAGWERPLLEKTVSAQTRITFGQSSGADVWCTPPQTEAAGLQFTVWWSDGQSASIQLSSHGLHMVDNALAAAAIARQAGVTPTEIAAGLSGFSPPPGRGTQHHTAQGWTVLNDTYNANPGSVRAALRALATMPTPGRRIAILGDMLELGEQAERLHKELLEEVQGIACLFTTGPLMRSLYDLAKHQTGIIAQHQHDPEAWIGNIRTKLKPGDLVLVKGSRGMKMERIVEDLLDHAI